MDGSRIRKFRIENGYSQKDLARLLSVNVRTISRWEQNINTPNPDELNKIAMLIGVTEEELLGDGINTTEETKQDVINRISDSVDNLITGQETINESLLSNRDEYIKRQDELILELKNHNESLVSQIASYKNELDINKAELRHKRILTIIVAVTCLIILVLVFGSWLYWMNHGFNDGVVKGSDELGTPSYFEYDDE